MLEKSDTLGGQRHSFSRDGFQWSAGIHDLSGFGVEQRKCAILDWLAETPIEMAPIGAVYDTLHIGSASPLRLSRPAQAQMLDLEKRIPGEGEAIDAWFASLEDPAHDPGPEHRHSGELLAWAD